MAIVFVDENGKIHTRGYLAHAHTVDPENPEMMNSLKDAEAILSFVQESFAPDYWIIVDGKVERFKGQAEVE